MNVANIMIPMPTPIPIQQTSCNGLNFKKAISVWKKMDNNNNGIELTYCDFCKKKYDIENVEKITNNLFVFYCDSYLLKPQKKHSLFVISLWSKDLKTNYDYNTETDTFNVPTNTEYDIYINSFLPQNQYFSIRGFINGEEILHDDYLNKLPSLYKSGCLISPRLIYIENSNNDNIRSNNIIELEISIYNENEINVSEFSNINLGEFKLCRDNNVKIIDSNIRHNVRINYNSEDKFYENILFSRVNKIPLKTTVVLKTTENENEINERNKDYIEQHMEIYQKKINYKIIRTNYKIKKYINTINNINNEIGVLKDKLEKYRDICRDDN